MPPHLKGKGIFFQTKLIHIDVMAARISVHYMYVVPSQGSGGIESPGTGVIGGCEISCGAGS